MWNSKPKRHDCNCRKHTRHNPKIVSGICYGFGYREAVRARISSKRLERAWLDAARLECVDDFEG